ncbi:hypothetical protein [Clostridium sp.]|uniref:hypothetical protein n=1 Tax=Clostridium sp. TaxID=1506 RepID=UPI002607A164|nr:hypothetical protein [Clostridium sp.]
MQKNKGEKVEVNGKGVQVKFKKIAHAIPQLIGNNRVFSNEECDICNQYFSTLENDLGNFIIPIRSIFDIKGKRGNKYKNNQLEIINNNDRIEINESKKLYNIEKCFKFDIYNKNAILELKTYKFIPSNVYKTFVKMALSLATESICKRLDLYNQYLMNNNIEKIPNMFLHIFYIPGMNKNKKLVVKHMIRKDSDERYPLIILSIRMAAIQFTVYLYEKNYYPMIKKAISIFPEIDMFQYLNGLFPEDLGIQSFEGNQKVSATLKIPFKYEKMRILNLKGVDYDQIKNMSIEEILEFQEKRTS